MKVRTYNTVPLSLHDPKELLEKIKRDGTVRESFDAGSTAQHVHNMYFLIGGRLRIENLLNTASGGAFVGDDLTVHMIRLNRKRLSKTTTVICIAPSRVWNASGGDGKWQKMSLAAGQGSIPFSHIVSGMWGNEAKTLDDILGDSGF
jgi:hypothetical protein